MRLWEGKEPQELLKRLHELDELTGIDSVIQPGQKVTVTATAYGSGLSRWTVDADDAAYRAPKIASGSKFDQFCAAFEGMTEELEADIYSVRVLAYNLIPDCVKFTVKTTHREDCTVYSEILRARPHHQIFIL